MEGVKQGASAREGTGREIGRSDVGIATSSNFDLMLVLEENFGCDNGCVNGVLRSGEEEITRRKRR